jgi:hypothetical protein
VTGIRSCYPSLSYKEAEIKRSLLSRLSSYVTSTDVEKSERTSVSLMCTKLKPKFSSYASLRVSISKEDFYLINNKGVSPNGRLIVYLWAIKSRLDLFCWQLNYV